MVAAAYKDRPGAEPFLSEWAQLSQEGLTDDCWSAEFWRVHDEWLAAGQPGCVRQFIAWRANQPPPGWIN